MQGAAVFGDLFLSAGAMKAGTTWLYRLLALHPEMHVTPEKELHYFHHRHVDNTQLDDAWRRQAVIGRVLPRLEPQKPEIDIDHVRATVDWAARYLGDAVDDRWFAGLFPPIPGYRCDFSNLHAHLPSRAWKQIAGQCDRLRVLYILREPVARAWSHVKFHLKYTGRLDRLDDWTDRELRAFARQRMIRDNGDYARVLRNMQAGLEPGQLKVMIYEDIHADPRAALAEIEGFLGIARFDYPDHLLTRKVNVSPDKPMPARFADLLARDTAKVLAGLERAGIALPESWKTESKSA